MNHLVSDIALPHRVTSIEQLESLYDAPASRSLIKEIDFQKEAPDAGGLEPRRPLDPLPQTPGPLSGSLLS